jgi:hypothetical protein
LIFGQFGAMGWSGGLKEHTKHWWKSMIQLNDDNIVVWMHQ